MSRHVLEASHIHPAIRDTVLNFHRNVVEEVQRAAEQHPVLVVGMKHNPFVKKARKMLDKANITHHYLEYGSYTKEWDARGALKLWTGWTTFPMVFVKGVFIGGATDLEKLLQSGEVK